MARLRLHSTSAGVSHRKITYCVCCRLLNPVSLINSRVSLCLAPCSPLPVKTPGFFLGSNQSTSRKHSFHFAPPRFLPFYPIVVDLCQASNSSQGSPAWSHSRLSVVQGTGKVSIQSRCSPRSLPWWFSPLLETLHRYRVLSLQSPIDNLVHDPFPHSFPSITTFLNSLRPSQLSLSLSIFLRSIIFLFFNFRSGVLSPVLVDPFRGVVG
jgi:hypothetical protein